MSTQIISPPEQPPVQPIPGSTYVQADELRRRLQKEIEIALNAIDSPAIHEIARTILHDLAALFDTLGLVADNLRKLDTLLENLSILEMLRADIQAFLDFIDVRVIHSDNLSQDLVEVLDGMSYAMAHDTKRIFERELADYITDYSTPVVYGKIVYAHGLLSNCLQQTMIAFLQTFNPSVDPVKLFNLEERVRQSLLLCNELSELMRVVRQAEEKGSNAAIQEALHAVIKFREESMQYLVYLDWQEYERLAFELLTSIETNANSTEVLHQYGCYLEVLYGHVKMRATVKNMFPSLSETRVVDF
jgi:hypothetical protein